MLIKIRYFAMLRDMTGLATDDIVVPHGCKADELINHIVARHPNILEITPFLRLANDTEYLSPTAILTDGETISLIPPVSGG